MPSVEPLSDAVPHQDQITVGSLLADIHRAIIPIRHADCLVAAICQRASYLLWEALGAPSDPAEHPVILPCNLNVVVPSNHGVGRYNGFVYVQPDEEECESPFYIVTHSRLVGIISHWINTAPLVLHVKGAVYVKVGSVDAGYKLLLNAIDDDAVLYLK
ncbi:hypothetical protein JVT61DRAFT_11377 [Boletus reticuloceps]|uniref:Uncharacterized protein n=1 Tax=Boletus reticuloceps TaxID=495285 RepID=A0A8I3A5H7_9AGAM|nr:hypothetical protein JVT61DRAFT_11377 [Boletus reticuloceps]